MRYALPCLLLLCAGDEPIVAPPPPDELPPPAIVTPAVPEPGWVTDCQVIDITDGDTIVVTVRKQIRVRLIDCWAPEIHGPQKPEGIKSRANLQKFAIGRKARLYVPEVGDDIGDMTSMGRVLGYVWIEKTNLSDMQVKQGFASKTKAKETEAFGPSK